MKQTLAESCGITLPVAVFRASWVVLSDQILNYWCCSNAMDPFRLPPEWVTLTPIITHTNTHQPPPAPAPPLLLPLRGVWYKPAVLEANPHMGHWIIMIQNVVSCTNKRPEKLNKIFTFLFLLSELLGNLKICFCKFIDGWMEISAATNNQLIIQDICQEKPPNVPA